MDRPFIWSDWCKTCHIKGRSIASAAASPSDRKSTRLNSSHPSISYAGFCSKKKNSLRYFCSPHHQDSALYPLIAQMERAAGFAHGDTPEVRLAKLQALLAATELPNEDVALL